MKNTKTSDIEKVLLLRSKLLVAQSESRFYYSESFGSDDTALDLYQYWCRREVELQRELAAIDDWNKKSRLRRMFSRRPI